MCVVDRSWSVVMVWLVVMVCCAVMGCCVVAVALFIGMYGPCCRAIMDRSSGMMCSNGMLCSNGLLCSHTGIMH